MAKHKSEKWLRLAVIISCFAFFGTSCPDDPNDSQLDAFITNNPLGGDSAQTVSCIYTLRYSYDYDDGPPSKEAADYGFESQAAFIRWFNVKGGSERVLLKTETRRFDNIDFLRNQPYYEYYEEDTTYFSAPSGQYLSGGYWVEISIDLSETWGKGNGCASSVAVFTP